MHGIIRLYAIRQSVILSGFILPNAILQNVILVSVILSHVIQLSFILRNLMSLSCKIFEHFALQVDPVIEFLKFGSTPFKDSTILAPKLADQPFWWKSLTPPPLNLDTVY